MEPLWDEVFSDCGNNIYILFKASLILLVFPRLKHTKNKKKDKVNDREINQLLENPSDLWQLLSAFSKYLACWTLEYEWSELGVGGGGV